ncbi:MAG: hypothetical protein HQ552_15530, partial [Desulfobacteraceae bacterium]|nr:hypothetical protein [Desulfobacteraceae bacterium]
MELQNSGTLLIPRETIAFIQQQGHKITTELEKIVKKEGQFTQDLAGKSKTIHLIALVPVFILSIL